MPFVKAADGLELYYEVEGEGFPLVFTHGHQGWGQQFYLQTKIMRRKYQCITHDLRGSGLSGKPDIEVYDTKGQAAYLHSILSELGIKRAVHIGHSWGGGISLQYYFDHPDEVAGIIFIGAYSSGSQIPVPESEIVKIVSTLEGRHHLFQVETQPFIVHDKFYKYSPYADEIGTLLWKEATKGPTNAAKAIVRGFFRFDFTDRLSEVKVPVLIVHGDSDKPCPYENTGKVLHDKIRDSQVVMVRGTGHFCHMEKPALANEAIWDWLEQRIKQY